ncbi:MAG: flippase [Chromatiaceae bacterium]|nr:flippase [Chromatiaceae bacterium]MCF7994140.1 flippase [Chromatiaceae bacterium]MCF8016215.1 flippase [Chromatiaceae bacterium]
MRLSPAFLHRRIAHRPNLVKIVDNIGWLFFDKMLRMGVGLFVGVWVARYLGPDQFGLINFATAFTSLFGAIAMLGLKDIVVRDIVRTPGCAGLTLGTAAVLQLIGGLITYVLIIACIAYLRPDDPLARSVVAILGSVMLMKASETAAYWFESQVNSKYTVWIQNSVFLIFAGIKVGLILQQAPLIAFVWATFAEAVVIALLLLIVLGWRGPALHFSAKLGISLLRDSWPLILSAIAVTVYMKIDQLMLGQMIGDEAVGIYSAAVRISEVWYFIPMAIVASVFPAILEAKKRSETQYYARLQSLYDLMVIISVSVAVPMTFLATPMIGLLFGASYIDAGPILGIHIWGGVFVSMGLARGKWLLAENLQYMGYWYVAFGMVTNVIGNYLLIPHFGITGAASMTVISQAMVALLAPALFKRTSFSAVMLARSLNIANSILRLRQTSNSNSGI